MKINVDFVFKMPWFLHSYLASNHDSNLTIDQ